MTIPGDNPIREAADDVLGRASMATSFVQRVLSLDASEGAVVGVLGPWGSGKTSFIYLALPEFKKADVPVIEFNPWLFSNTEQLVDHFFNELAAQLKNGYKLNCLSKPLRKYGKLFTVKVGLSLGFLNISAKSKLPEEGMRKRRERVERALNDYSRPIVVVLDDIDRLSTPEIREVFKLVRLTASFPNLIYVTAFDRERVEKALEEDSLSGRDYLEKILQVTVDLPTIPSEVLKQQVTKTLEEVLQDIQVPDLNEVTRWPDIYFEIIRPVIRNIRDVRRYRMAIDWSLREMNGDIAWVDVLALEAIRMFLPDVFSRLPRAIEGLTTTSTLQFGNRSEPPHLKNQIDSLFKSVNEEKRPIVRALIERVFPAASRHIDGNTYGAEFENEWFNDRRVAHADILLLYLHRIANENLLTFRDAEEALSYMSDREALEGFFQSLDKERLFGVISALETLVDQFSEEQAVPGATALINVIPDLPSRAKGALPVRTSLYVKRIVYRLLCTLPDETAIESAVRDILPKLNSLSAKLELLNIVGYRENSGHELISEQAAEDFERDWRDKIRSTPIEKLNLAKEYDLMRVYRLAMEEADPSEDSVEIPDEPFVTLSVLRSAQTVETAQSVSSRVIHRAKRLDWDSLVKLYGDGATLRKRIETLKETTSEGAEELLELTEKYLNGWRPENHDGMA